MLLTLNALPQLRSRPSLLIDGRFHFIHPIPLPRHTFHSHCTIYRLINTVDRCKRWKCQSENNKRWDVKKQILGLHEQLEISPNTKSFPRIERYVVLVHASSVPNGWQLNSLDKKLTSFSNKVHWWCVVKWVRKMCVSAVFMFRPGSIRIPSCSK